MNISEIITWGNLNNKNNLDLNHEVQAFKIDSRNISSGDVFVALKGENTRGEEFLDMAFERGASFAIVGSDYDGQYEKVLYSDDVLKSFQSIGRNNLNKSGAKVVAITGSMGKTTTKEVVAEILSTKYNVFKSEGNYNTQTGIPMMLTRLNENHEIAVIEMGMDRFGDILGYSEMTNHNIAVITNIGSSHMEFFGSKDKIFEGKMHIADNFTEKSTLVINAEDEYLNTLKDKNYELIRTGNVEKSGLYVENIVLDENGSDFDLVLGSTSYKCHLSLLGRHNISNALLGVAIGLKFDIEIQNIVKSLGNVKNAYMRLQKIKNNGIMYISDCYNSSLESIKVAMDFFRYINSSRKIAVIGDIYETGVNKTLVHTEIGNILNEYSLDMVYFVGEFIEVATQSYMGKFIYIKNKNDVVARLVNYLKQDDAVLFKASRGMELEKIIDKVIKEKQIRII